MNRDSRSAANRPGARPPVPETSVPRGGSAGDVEGTGRAGGHGAAAERRKVAFATVIGTTIEWYDFFIYATAAGLVFQDAFFKPAGPGVGTLLSFFTVGLSFLFRPLGAFLAGHFGDRIGRKPMLVVTLLAMGFATTLIGVLPTYAQIGVLAPTLLILLRVVQGISAGGEWGGAVLLAVEHARSDRRGRFGAFPQLGVPLGLLAASGMIALASWISGDAFGTWGWRIPFLFSIVLIVVGYIVRRSVQESPAYLEIAERAARSRVPIVDLFRHHWRSVLVCALLFAGNNAVGYMTTGGFVQNYASARPDAGGVLGMDRVTVQLAVLASAVVWLAATWSAGWLADVIGRRRTYLVGWVVQFCFVLTLFPLINTHNVALFVLGLSLLAIGLGLTYGPQAAWYSETFPASIRFSGVAISYALGSILGGAFAPFIASWLRREFSIDAVTVYLCVMTVVGFVAALLLRERKGIPLGEAIEQSGEWETWEPPAGSSVSATARTHSGR